MCKIRHGNNYGKFPNPSKFEPLARTMAEDAIKEGVELRKKIQGKRILVRGECVDRERWELINSFRL